MKTFSKLSLIGIVGVTLVSASQAFAAPAAEQVCPHNIVNPPNGHGAKFDDTCTTAYVLPPVTGTAKAVAASPNTNINFCPAVLQVGSVTTKTMTAENLIADKILAMIADFDPLSTEITSIKTQLAQAQAASAAADATLSADNSQKNDLVAAVADAKNTYDTCVLLNSPTDCADANTALVSAKNDLKNFVLNTLSPDQKADTAAKAQFQTLTQELANDTTELANALAPLFGLQGQLEDLNTSVMQTYDKYTRMSGLAAQLTYSIPWGSLISSYQAANPGINFTALPIKSTQFSAGVNPILNGTGGQTPAILAFSIPGMPGQGAQFFPTGDGTIQPLGSSATSPDVGPQTMAFGTAVSAQIVVSLLGACPYYPNGLAGPVVGDLSNLTANMISNLNYKYEVTARRGYTATYNMAQFVSRLETVKKTGGFFSSKTLHDIQESASSSDWFSIAFDQTAAGFNYTDQEKANITREAKGQLMERALVLIAVQNGSLPGGSGSTAQLAPTGAGMAAGYLMEGCGFWSWCEVGGWVLGVLDSIFGSETAVSNFQKSNNVWVTDHVVDKTILDWSDGLSFAKP